MQADDDFDFDFGNEEDVTPVGKSAEPEIDPNSFEVEIVDDTPPEDQNRKPFEAAAEEDHEEEVENYSKKVKKRIDQLNHKFHDERREKERLAREHAEAVRMAQTFYSRMQELENTLTWGQGKLTEEATSRLDYQQQIAQEKYRKAFEIGDSEGVLAAQDELNKLAIERNNVQNWAPPAAPQRQQTALQPNENAVYNAQEAVQQPAPRDYKAEEWSAKNPWFGKDAEMTAFAYGVHERLVKSGVDPTSDEYYEKVDARIREVFPQQFNRPKKTSNVASVGRTTAPKKVTISASEAAIAKRLGLTNEQYAREKMKGVTING